MRHLTEYAQRILAELEEPHEQDIVPIINDVTERSPLETDFSSVKAASKELLDAGLIDVALRKFYPGVRTPLENAAAHALLDALESWISFGGRGDFWFYTTIDMRKDLYPMLILTNAGLETSRQILGSRGYRWWRGTRSAL